MTKEKMFQNAEAYWQEASDLYEVGRDDEAKEFDEKFRRLFRMICKNGWDKEFMGIV